MCEEIIKYLQKPDKYRIYWLLLKDIKKCVTNRQVGLPKN